MVLHYMNNKWVTEDECKVSVFDLSFMRGVGVFEYIRTYNGRPFMVDKHVDRLLSSCNAMEIACPLPKLQLLPIISEGIDKNKDVGDMNIRVIITAGIATKDNVHGRDPSVFVLYEPYIPYPPEYYKGIAMISMKHERLIPNVKTLTHMAAVLGKQKAIKKGAHDVLYVSHDGKISEGTTWNIFFVKDYCILTPKTDYVLDGITRNVVETLVKNHPKYKLEEMDIRLENVSDMDEAFITSTTREVMPVAYIDGAAIGNASPGPVTKDIMNMYTSYVLEQCK